MDKRQRKTWGTHSLTDLLQDGKLPPNICFRATAPGWSCQSGKNKYQRPCHPQSLGATSLTFAHPLKKKPGKISQEKYEIRKNFTTLFCYSSCWTFTTTWGSTVNSIFPVCKCWRSSLGISATMILISCDNMFNLHFLPVQQEHLWCKQALYPSAILWCLKMRDKM